MAKHKNPDEIVIVKFKVTGQSNSSNGENIQPIYDVITTEDKLKSEA